MDVLAAKQLKGMGRLSEAMLGEKAKRYIPSSLRGCGDIRCLTAGRPGDAVLLCPSGALWTPCSQEGGGRETPVMP